MEFDHDNVRRKVEEDRLSSLPDELIHKIMYSFDMKFVVQTCVLSSRWEFLWTSMPNLNFSSEQFISLPKFAKFVNNVLSHRNHQIEVSSVKLDFDGETNEDFVSKIANYAFSHNVQELTVSSGRAKNQKEFPPCLFSSQSLKHFTLSTSSVSPHCIGLDTRFDFSALTTMHISNITICGTICGDLFSKCVNLKSLTLEHFIFIAYDVEEFDIIAPRLSNLMLIEGEELHDINLIAPQLENLTIIDCSTIKCLNAPPGLVSLCYKDYCPPLQFSKEGFRSLNKVTICLSEYSTRYKEKYAHKIISMLQELHSARYVTLSANIVECISSFPHLLSLFPSPFSNLINLSIDYSMRKKDEYNVKMCGQVINSLLENSSSTKFILELPKDGSRR